MTATINLTDGTSFTIDGQTDVGLIVGLVRELARPYSGTEFGLDDSRGRYRSFTPDEVDSLTIARAH